MLFHIAVPSNYKFPLIFKTTGPRFLKITEIVSCNIASEASYVYILIGQKLIENAKKTNMASFWKSKAFDQTVLPDRSLSIGKTLVEDAKIILLKCDIFGTF